MREVDRELILRSVPTMSMAEEHASGNGSSSPILLVDSREACMHEAGELIDAQIKAEEMIEIGELIPDECSTYDQLKFNTTSRLSTHFSESVKSDYARPITLFKSVGIALQDVAIAAAVVDEALGTKIGTIIPNYDVL